MIIVFVFTIKLALYLFVLVCFTYVYFVCWSFEYLGCGLILSTELGDVFDFVLFLLIWFDFLDLVGLDVCLCYFDCALFILILTCYLEFGGYLGVGVLILVYCCCVLFWLLNCFVFWCLDFVLWFCCLSAVFERDCMLFRYFQVL